MRRWQVSPSAKSPDGVVHTSWRVRTSAPWLPSRGLSDLPRVEVHLLWPSYLCLRLLHPQMAVDAMAAHHPVSLAGLLCRTSRSPLASLRAGHGVTQELIFGIQAHPRDQATQRAADGSLLNVLCLVASLLPPQRGGLLPSFDQSSRQRRTQLVSLVPLSVRSFPTRLRKARHFICAHVVLHRVVRASTQGLHRVTRDAHAECLMSHGTQEWSVRTARWSRSSELPTVLAPTD